MNAFERDEVLCRVREVARFVSKRTVYACVGQCVVPMRYIPKDVVLTRIVVVEPSECGDCPCVFIFNEQAENVSVVTKRQTRPSSDPIAIPCHMVDHVSNTRDGV